MLGVHLRTWRFVLVLVIVVSVVAHVGQCEAEVEELRESRCQFQQHSINSFFASRFTLILLAHGIDTLSIKVERNF